MATLFFKLRDFWVDSFSQHLSLSPFRPLFDSLSLFSFFFWLFLFAYALSYTHMTLGLALSPVFSLFCVRDKAKTVTRPVDYQPCSGAAASRTNVLCTPSNREFQSPLIFVSPFHCHPKTVSLTTAKFMFIAFFFFYRLFWSLCVPTESK